MEPCKSHVNVLVCEMDLTHTQGNGLVDTDILQRWSMLALRLDTDAWGHYTTQSSTPDDTVTRTSKLSQARSKQWCRIKSKGWMGYNKCIAIP